jgi:GNAT superfamily N-acetyltransferase
LQAGEPVGCLLVTTEWSDWRNGDWWWLQSVYVVPGARRRGVFRALHAEVERRARAAGGVVGLRL